MKLRKIWLVLLSIQDDTFLSPAHVSLPMVCPSQIQGGVTPIGTVNTFATGVKVRSRGHNYLLGVVKWSMSPAWGAVKKSRCHDGQDRVKICYSLSPKYLEIFSYLAKDSLQSRQSFALSFAFLYLLDECRALWGKPALS